MKSKLNFVAGLLLGIFLVTGTGTAAAVAESVAATLTASPIYVDGERVTLQGYNIGGNNYFKLRDLGAIIGFDVEWDSKTSSIQITTDASEQAAPSIDADTSKGNEIAPVKLQAGDNIVCSDGYVYEIKDTSRYSNSMFASEETSALPTATCDWSLLVQPELPDAENRHYTIGGKEYLFMRNLYETRRMQYTLYNAIGANSQTWQNGKPVTRADGSPLVRINLSIPDEVNAYSFWPWRSSQITDLFNSCPPGEYSLEAWDVYCDGAFRYTEYYIYVT